MCELYQIQFHVIPVDQSVVELATACVTDIDSQWSHLSPLHGRHLALKSSWIWVADIEVVEVQKTSGKY